MGTILVALFALLIGLGFVFLGYRIFLVLLPIWGFFAGLWLGAEVITLLFGDGFLATTTSWIAGIVVGIIFGLLSYLFYALGVAIVAGSIGWALASGIMGAIGFNIDGFVVFVVALGVAAVFAIVTLVLNLQKYVIILLTAVAGANAVLTGVLLLFGTITLAQLQAAGNAVQPVLRASWFWALAWLALAVVGVVAQVRANRSYVFVKEDYVEGWG